MDSTQADAMPQSPASAGEVERVRVYLASRFSRRHECHALGRELQARGARITSRWTKPETDPVLPVGSSEQAADHERERFAREDVEDVQAANWTISLMEPPRGGGRGGRHVEFGYALALGHRLTIIGPRETVFHHMPQVEHFDTVEAFIASLPAALTPPAQSVDDLIRQWRDQFDAMHRRAMRAEAQLRALTPDASKEEVDVPELVVRLDDMAEKHSGMYGHRGICGEAADALRASQPPEQAGMVKRTEAAGRIIDVMTGGNFDWRARLHESDFLESGDWLTALAYADAALTAAQAGTEK